MTHHEPYMCFEFQIHSTSLISKPRRDSHDLPEDTAETYWFLRRSQVRVHGCCIQISSHFAAVARCEEQMASDVNVNFTRPQKKGLTDLIMGWLRLVDSLKLQVSFVEYRFFYRALCQKRPMILRSLLIEATPYVESCSSAGGSSFDLQIRIMRSERETWIELLFIDFGARCKDLRSSNSLSANSGSSDTLSTHIT